MSDTTTGFGTGRARVAAACLSLAMMASGCALEPRPKGAGCDGTAAVCPAPTLRTSLDKARTAGAGTFADFDKAIEDMVEPGGTNRLKSLRGEPPAHALIVSSGGAWGAFGAGFMKGLSEGATDKLQFAREYDLVTGVSTGAVLSTFLFLGRYDEIYQLYMTVGDEKIFKSRPLGLPSLLFFNSLAKTDPLRALLESHITAQVLDDVAQEAEEQNRRLFVGAVDLDTGRLAAINLAAIAKNRSNPRRVADYIDAIMASAAIPIKFNPQFIQNDMYVDGAARAIMLFADHIVSVTERRNAATGNHGKWTVYLLINGDEDPISCECTRNHGIAVAQRTLAVLWAQNQTNNVYRIWREVTSEPRHWLAYHAGPPSGTCAVEYQNQHGEFDNAFMTCLGPAGQRLGRSGTPWNDDFSAIIGEDGFMQ